MKAREDARRLAGTEGLLAALDRDKLDAIIAPSMSPAWLTDHVLGDRFVGAGYSMAAVAGTPSVTVPIGDVHGLPLGLTIMGRAYSERDIIALAYALEQKMKARKAAAFKLRHSGADDDECAQFAYVRSRRRRHHEQQQSMAQQISSLYRSQDRNAARQPADLGAYRGKVTLVVNTASECGYTPQYEGLEALHRSCRRKDSPCSAFRATTSAARSPARAQQIAEFCRKNYGVTFPMFAKLSTRPGPGQSPIYAFLGTSGHLPAWNFSKYVIGKDGKVVAFFPSAVTPESAGAARGNYESVERRSVAFSCRGRALPC